MQKIIPVIIISFAILLGLVMRSPHLHKDVVGMHAWRQSQTQTNTLNFLYFDDDILAPPTK